MNILTDAQFGFIPRYGTKDINFALHSFIAKFSHKEKLLNCCFVTYVKASGNISHLILWPKLYSVDNWYSIVFNKWEPRWPSDLYIVLLLRTVT